MVNQLYSNVKKKKKKRLLKRKKANTYKTPVFSPTTKMSIKLQTPEQINKSVMQKYVRDSIPFPFMYPTK